MSDEKRSRRQRSPPPDGAAFVGIAHGAAVLHHWACRYSAALSIRPRQASEMMSCTPLRPPSTRWRRNADQPVLSSLVPSQMPKIVP